MNFVSSTLVISLALTLWAPHVDAREPTTAESATKDAAQTNGRELAQVSFDKGLDAADRGDWQLALDSFLESQKHEAAPGTTLNLARCKENLGRIAEAIVDFESVVNELPADDERAEYARTRISVLEPRVGRVTLSLPPQARDARVFWDGVELTAKALRSSFPVEPGEHEVLVTAPRREREIIQLEVAAGDDHEIVLEGGIVKPTLPPKVVPPPPMPKLDSGPSTQKILGFTGVGIGAAGLAVSALTGLMTLDRKNAMEANCDDSVCNSEGIDASESGSTLATVSTVSFGAGLAFLGTGAALLYLETDSEGTQRLAVQPRGDGAQIVFGGSL